MFIDVQKVTLIEKKDSKGNVVKNPISDKVITSDIKVDKETIKVSEIKSARKWFPSPEHKSLVKEELTVIYLFGSSKDKDPAKMIIKESHEEFSKRLNSIQI